MLHQHPLPSVRTSIDVVAKEPTEEEHKGRTLMSVFTELPRGNVRLGAAGPGEILVSAETIEQLGSRFDYQELPPLRLKGKEKPFRCFAIQRSKFAVSVVFLPPWIQTGGFVRSVT